MNIKPNLFDFATSELSQDAFLAWLIQYADSRFADDDTGAYAAGRRFLDVIFERCACRKLPGEMDVKVERQHCHIDVYARIRPQGSKEEYVLVLEDKVGTTIHDDQLNRYRAIVESEGFDKAHTLLVYCQTQNESASDDCKNAGFSQIGRKDLLRILPESSANLIIASFRDRMIRLERGTNEWETCPMWIIDEKTGERRSGWNWLAWQGFFMALRAKLGDGNWAYVPNPSGGFLGYWWHWRTIQGGSLYLQLEEDKACFKVEAAEGVDPGDMKWIWHVKVMEKARELGVKAIKPPVMRKGAWMTVATYDGDFRIPRDGDVIDIEKTIENLKGMESVVDMLSK